MIDETSPRSVPPLERRLATILCADIAGYSQKMGDNEERTVRVFREHREIFESLVEAHRGRIFNTAGDALLVEFNSAVEAVRCATEIQAALRTRNEHLSAEEKMLFRIGINLGDVIVQGGDLLGDGVNVAARIQTSTEPGGICISGSVHDQIQNKLSLDFKLLGEQTYKNIAKPIRTYTINEGAAVTKAARPAPVRLWAAMAAALVACAAAGYWGYWQYEASHIEQRRIEAQMAAQLDAQRQATEQARRAADEARRETQLQAQKMAADEAARRAQDERNKLEQDRKLLEQEKRAAMLARQQAADEAQRRAQAQQAQLAQERQRLDAEKQALAAAGKQAEDRQRAAPVATARPNASVPFTANDGSYAGRLCNHAPGKTPYCWPIALTVRGGVVDGSWPSSSTQKTARARGAVAADGSFQLQLSAWAPTNGTPVVAVLHGRMSYAAIAASGQWRTPSGAAGDGVTGEWKRAP